MATSISSSLVAKPGETAGFRPPEGANAAMGGGRTMQTHAQRDVPPVEFKADLPQIMALNRE